MLSFRLIVDDTTEFIATVLVSPESETTAKFTRAGFRPDFFVKYDASDMKVAISYFKKYVVCYLEIECYVSFQNILVALGRVVHSLSGGAHSVICHLFCCC